MLFFLVWVARQMPGNHLFFSFTGHVWYGGLVRHFVISLRCLLPAKDAMGIEAFSGSIWRNRSRSWMCFATVRNATSCLRQGIEPVFGLGTPRRCAGPWHTALAIHSPTFPYSRDYGKCWSCEDVFISDDENRYADDPLNNLAGGECCDFAGARTNMVPKPPCNSRCSGRNRSVFVISLRSHKYSELFNEVPLSLDQPFLP